jgi:hypothetical protein
MSFDDNNRAQGSSSAPATLSGLPGGVASAAHAEAASAIRFHARKSAAVPAAPTTVLGPRRRPNLGPSHHIGTLVLPKEKKAAATGDGSHAPFGTAGSSVALGVSAVQRALTLTSGVNDLDTSTSSAHNLGHSNSITSSFRWHLTEKLLAVFLVLDFILTATYLVSNRHSSQ